MCIPQSRGAQARRVRKGPLMAIKVIQQKLSDLSGTEGTDDQFVEVIVRQHKPITDLVALEVRNADGTTRDVYVRQAEFDKWCSDNALQNARSTRGRVPGTRINGQH